MYSTYGIISVEINNQEIEMLRDTILLKNKTPAKTYSNDHKRKVDLYRVDKLKPLRKFFWNKALRLNETFKYDIKEIQDIQYLRYQSGHFYDWHIDIESNDIASLRKISMSLVLNPTEFEGGELIFFDAGNTIKIKDDKPMLYAFSSFLNHTVNPVVSGTRESIVCWINGNQCWR